MNAPKETLRFVVIPAHRHTRGASGWVIFDRAGPIGGRVVTDPYVTRGQAQATADQRNGRFWHVAIEAGRTDP